jgi:parallel beta-helix repeat protein
VVNTWKAINLSISTDNIFNWVVLHNNDTGIDVQNSATNNLFVGITAFALSGNGTDEGNGIDIRSSSGNNTVIAMAAFNNDEHGIRISNSPNNTIINSVAANNLLFGLYLRNGSDMTTVSDFAAFTTNVGIGVDASSNNTFTRRLMLGNTSQKNCLVIAYNGSITTANNPGMDDDADSSDVETDTVHTATECVIEGSSDFALTTGIDLSSSYMGKVASNDNANDDDNLGWLQVYPTQELTFDWLNYDNPYRGWGIDGSAFPNANHQGRWVFSTGAGRIWDWSLRISDSVIRNVHYIPSGDDFFTHTWAGTGPSNYLNYAIEINDDGIGNDNSLCESGETCLFTPNMGSYQGHGDLIEVGMIGTGSTIENVTLMQYENNGY